MNKGRLTAGRVGLVALGVLALHVLLIGSVSDRLAASFAPRVTPAYEPRPADLGRAIQIRSDPSAAARKQVDDSDYPPDPAARSIATPAAPASALPARAEALTPGVSASDTASLVPQPEAAEPTDRALPIPATRMPPPFAYAYTLTRGAAAGEVELRWQPDGERYVATLQARDGAGELLALSSVGAFDPAGIAPQRFVDRRRGRGALAVNFRRDTGDVTFSGPQVVHALVPGMQDRLSWLLQLGAIAAADPDSVAAAGAAMTVVGVRGESDVWQFEAIGPQILELAGGEFRTLRLLRRPLRAYDTRAEVWLAPSHDYLPLRVLLSNGGETLKLEWRGAASTP